MATACSCRTSVLRTFIRSVVQIHVPNENLARTPWHEIRRQAHKRTTTTWPAGPNLRYRTIHTSAESRAPAQDENAHPASAEAEEQRPSQEIKSEPPSNESDIPKHAEADTQDTSAWADVLIEMSKPGPKPLQGNKTRLKREARAAKREARLKAEADMLFEVKMPGPKPLQGQKLKVKRQARLAKREARRAARAARLEAREKNSAAPQPETPAGQPRTNDQTFDIPDEEEFSVEEVRIAEGRKEKQRSEKERARRLKKKEDQRQKAEEERIAQEKERRKNRPMWAVQKEALQKKFPEGWRPHKRLSPDALSAIRALNQQFPDMFTTQVLSRRFEMSPEAIRRMLRTNWEPSADEDEDRQRRWYRRGVAIWEKYEALGIKPPKKWRDAAMAKNGPRHRAWDVEGGWDGERGEEREEEHDEAETERKRRLKTQRRLAQNLM